MAEDLYVCDVDYDIFACQIQDYWEAEDKVLKKLISILSKTYDHGIALGDAHDSIGILKNAIVNIYNSTKGEGDNINKITLDFLKRIDEIDLKLYGDVEVNR